MEAEGSLPCSQQPPSGPYPQPVASSPHLPSLIIQRSILVLSSHVRVGLSSGVRSSFIFSLILKAFPSINVSRGPLEVLQNTVGEPIFSSVLRPRKPVLFCMRELAGVFVFRLYLFSFYICWTCLFGCQLSTLSLMT
jgi:hypothetical protein